MKPVRHVSESRAPLIAHVIFRLDVGGLENGLVNLLNGLPYDRFRHAIICIDRSTAFRERIKRPDVEIIDIRKRPGRDLGALRRLYDAMRRLQPRIVHTRNLGALDALLPAALVGVPVRIHGEHGWSVADVDGTSRKDRWLRKLHSPLIRHYVVVSNHIRNYLETQVGISQSRITRICNGVDTDHFRPVADRHAVRASLDPVLMDAGCVIGTVGRMDPVKDHLGLLRSFARLVTEFPDCGHVKLAIVGDGQLQDAARDTAASLGIENKVWMPGRRDDIRNVLGAFDVFVQPSLAEGISNTILEAMATGLPVIATEVGGNPELVVHDETGSLVPPGRPDVLAAELHRYVTNPSMTDSRGAASRIRTEREFSIRTMVSGYQSLYEKFLV